MRRRNFIQGIAASVAWPLTARAQQPREEVKHIGVLLPSAADDPVYQAWVGAFLQGLEQLGWSEGRNLRIDYRWGGDSDDALTRYVAELVALAPDVILTSGNLVVDRLLQVTHTVPIVFAIAVDPVGTGFVNSLSRPGGNATGFMQFDYSLSAKWPELLKEIAPGVTRAAVLREATLTAGIGQFAIIQYVAPSVSMEVSAINLRDIGEIERDVAAFARSPNGGLIVTGSAFAAVHRDPIIATAALHKLPAILHQPRLYRPRWPYVLWSQFHGPVPARGSLCRPYPQGREAGRPTGAGTHQVRTCNQPQDGKSTRHQRANLAARPRRRGDRMTALFPQRAMSAIGTKRTLPRRT